MYPDVFRAFAFERGRIDGDTIYTRVGSIQKRAFDAGVADDQGVTEQMLFDFYCSERVPTDNPGVFEWLDICETVQAARGTYTFVELGAGYARWSVIAHSLATRFRRLRTRLVCVEPEPTHYQWALDNLRSNGVRPWRRVVLQGAVAAKDGYVVFDVGDPARWYGQAIVQAVELTRRQRLVARLRSAVPWRARPDVADRRGTRLVRAYSLQHVLAPLASVDLVHMDVQGSEREVVAASIDSVTEKVRRLHIGTHSAEIETDLLDLLPRHGWECVRSHAGRGRRATEHGEMDFEDGLQTWVNRRLG